MTLTREFADRPYRKSSRSGAGNDCVFLPADGTADAVADSKTGAVLAVPAARLVAWAKRA